MRNRVLCLIFARRRSRYHLPRRFVFRCILEAYIHTEFGNALGSRRKDFAYLGFSFRESFGLHHKLTKNFANGVNKYWRMLEYGQRSNDLIRKENLVSQLIVDDKS